jgi:hypothetical protein
MMEEQDEQLFARKGLTLVPDARHEDAAPGPGHRHHWELVSTNAGLQSAHVTLDWDVSTAGRIVGVNKCSLCGDLHRGSVRACKTRHCRTHPVCATPPGVIVERRPDA